MGQPRPICLYHNRWEEMTVDSYNDYSKFVQLCNQFADLFADAYFQKEALFCHPLKDGVIYVQCTDKEKNTHALDICKMADMLLMSRDGEAFLPFELEGARKIAEESHYVFLTSLLGGEAFKAADWMIDGKHDQYLGSNEERQKAIKSGKFAAVTGDTNVYLPYRKLSCPFLYEKGTIEDPKLIVKSDVNDKLDKYIEDNLAEFDHIEVIGETEFEVLGSKIKTDRNESRCAALDKSLPLIDKLMKAIDENAAALKAVDDSFDRNALVAKALCAASDKCGVKIDEKLFEGAKVESVNTMNRHPKVRRRGRIVGKAPESKKAVVKLTADSKDIEIFAGL